MQLFRLKSAVIFIHDLLWVSVAIFLAYWFRFNLSTVPVDHYASLWMLCYFAVPSHALTFWLFGCYRGIWRFASLPDLWRLLRAVAVGAAIASALYFLYARFAGVPRSVIVLYPILLFFGVSTSRVAYRMLKTHHFSLEREDKPRALIVGAGHAGDSLIRDVLQHKAYTPVALVDDHPAKQGTELHGVRVMGKITQLPELINSLNIQVVLIAMPSAPRSVMDEITTICAKQHIPCRTLPSMVELAGGRVEVSRLRPVTVNDLLGRDPVQLDKGAVNAYIAGKCIAVTGGGGSIGSELCRHLVKHNPAKLLILESNEFNLYRIERELSKQPIQTKIIPVLVDIRVKDSVEYIFNRYRPDTVFHSAAYKHVPMVELNTVEAVRNNVFGTKVVADAAVKSRASIFVQVSTDKTVNPANVMGATKRIAEIYCQTINGESETQFVTTRFGNVLGSAGSVVPLFEQQIKTGGPVTVTHPEITRYFMTIPEAASLILQAGAMGKGGEIFVLDMGKPVKIRELAENMIRLCGLELGKDINIEYIGLRPGEKMHEELFYSKENLVGTGHPKLLLANCISCCRKNLQQELALLSQGVSTFDEKSILNCIARLVPEFTRQGNPENVIPLNSSTELVRAVNK